MEKLKEFFEENKYVFLYSLIVFAVFAAITIPLSNYASKRDAKENSCIQQQQTVSDTIYISENGDTLGWASQGYKL